MLWSKLLVIALIAGGETSMILAQIYGAQVSSLTGRFWLTLSPGSWYFWAAVGGILLVISGYFYGITVFRNIWLVSLVSWTAVVVVETSLAWFVFHTVPEGRVL